MDPSISGNNSSAASSAYNPTWSACIMEDISNFDDLLTHLGTGRWNIIYFLGAGLLYFFWAPHSLTVLYMAPALNYTCLPPDNTTSVSGDSCTYVRVTEEGAEVQEPCTEWDFDTSVFTNTLTSEFQLVCSRAYLRATYVSVYTFGSILTCILWGYLADRYGRKMMVVVSHVLMAITLISFTFLPVFSVILLFRVLLGLFTNTTFYSLAMEVCEIKHRSAVGILIGLPWAVGTMAWGAIGYLIRDWRWLNMAISIPFLIIFVFIYLVDESPRWLLVTGKEDKAWRVMQRAARMNHVRLPTKDHLTGLLEKTQEPEPKVKERKAFYKQCGWPRMLSTYYIRLTTTIYAAMFFITALVFTGLNLSGSLFSANPFLYVVMVGVMELPGYTLTVPIINRWGRKVPLMVAYFICGVSILSIVLVPADMSWLVMTLAMVGKLTVSGAFMTLVMYQAELLPTVVRLQGKGILTLTSSIAYCITPYITDLLGMLFPWLPSVIFGMTSLAVCVVLTPLPETLGMPLPETLKDLEKLWKRKWTWSRTSSEVVSKTTTVTVPL